MRWFFGRGRRRNGRSGRIVLEVGPNLRSQVRQINAFLTQHDGPGHFVRVAPASDGQTLYCSCGQPAAGRAQSEVPLALLEDDLIDP